MFCVQSKTIFWWDIENCKVRNNILAKEFYGRLKRRLIEEGFIRELEVNIVVPFHDCDEPANLELSKEIIAHRVKEYNNKNIFFTYLNFLFILLINWSSFCVSFRTGIRRSKCRPKKMKERRNNQITDKYIKAEIEKWFNFFSSLSYFFIRLQLSKSDHMILFIYLYTKSQHFSFYVKMFYKRKCKH